jgi:hypothetical protein
VFNTLTARQDDWVRALLSLASHGSGAAVPPGVDLTFVNASWGDDERGLEPPLSLLSYLIRNLAPPRGTTTTDENRARLLVRDPETIEKALGLLRSGSTNHDWWIFEGPSYPDVFIETPGALVVVEGKRTEPGPTICTRWMAERHQIWRHMDAAWEIRGQRAVFGLLLVDGGNDDAVPSAWQAAASDTLSARAISGSFPHRGAAERDAIVEGFLGVSTWQIVCQRFGIDHGSLPRTVDDLRVSSLP